MDDLIERKKAIDAIMDADVCVTWNGVISDDDAVDIAIKSTKGSVISSIVNMPSAQPETHDKRTETHGVCLDVIDRQATLDWLKNEWNGMIASLFDGIKALPSAQPEQTNSWCINSWCNNCKEIVRCKDCKWFHDIGCAIRIVDDSDKPLENDYCSFAERRTDVNVIT